MSRKKPSPLQQFVTALIFFLVGVAMLLGSYLTYTSAAELVEDGVEAQGEVVEIVKEVTEETRGTGRNRRRETVTTYYPVIAFEDADGNSHRFRASTGAGSRNTARSVGETVPILYDPESPDDAKVNSFFALWGAPLSLGFIGSGFFLGGGIWGAVLIARHLSASAANGVQTHDPQEPH